LPFLPGPFPPNTVNGQNFPNFTTSAFDQRLRDDKLEWVEAGGEHRLFSASSDIHDDAEHNLVTAYAALRPDGRWSLLVINKDQENPHGVRIVFHDAETNRDRRFSGPVDFITFGTEQYQWHPGFEDGKADPDGPPARRSTSATSTTVFELPKASVTVIRGSVAP
jgi:hypothetical protein